jgi:hypothetical protein
MLIGTSHILKISFEFEQEQVQNDQYLMRILKQSLTMLPMLMSLIEANHQHLQQFQ